jgi:hypothetical protein
MPVLDGFAAAQEIRRERPPTEAGDVEPREARGF